MNKQAEKKVGKAFEELTSEEMNKVQGSFFGGWGSWSSSSSSSSSSSCYSTRCSYSCCSSRCCGC
ncbi:serine-rich class II lanthipeptide [Enterococcus ureasiticus]|uniref:serine-rich class II lanthipeptide n=1 Tax=Enterococcus ureasiticus TaxID=903984 RepID=UPI001112E30F|nr:serine-rich class II lanthipeptide [Enterococcus ureasiticus]